MYSLITSNKERNLLEDRILIVDDEEMICSILARRLTKEGYFCFTAKNGKEALHHFYKNSFSVIISDIRMPEINGIELLKNVKAVRPNMTVIMMTAYPEINMAVEAIRFGANDFILKPVDLDLVVFSVKKALEKKKLEEELESHRNHLEELVEEKTGKLQEAYHVLQRTHLNSIKILSGAIDAKDPYTRGHSDRVRTMSVRIGMKLGFSEKRLESLDYGSLLHDIGKIGIKDVLLQKPGPLSPEEYQSIQEHTLIGVKIIEEDDFFKDKLPMIRSHHERFDGSGYPDGLAGEAIPLEARIISVPDAFDAMTSLRHYRRAIPLEKILIELKRGKGKQFDPQILEIFLREKIYKS